MFWPPPPSSPSPPPPAALPTLPSAVNVSGGADSASIVMAARALTKVLSECEFGKQARCLAVTAAAGGPPTADEYSAHNEPSADVLLRLFLLGKSCSTADAMATLGEDCFVRLHTLGLLWEKRDSVSSSVMIYPLELPACAPTPRTVLVATDWDRVDICNDAVMPIGVDSLQLALALQPTTVACKRVLDVCCGSGIQGICAAALGASRVLSTDVSVRAVQFTHFGAVLNGLDNIIATAIGDAYAPALSASGGEPTFDVVLANPPFVAVPRSLALAPALYVSGGDDGADIVRQLLAGADAVLCAEGTLLIVGQLPNMERAHEWLHTSLPPPRDQWELAVVHDTRHTMRADRYAKGRAADMGCTRRETQQWVAALADAGVTSMGFGVVVVHRHGISAGCGADARGCGRQVLVHYDGPSNEARATMLEGRGLQQLQQTIERCANASHAETACARLSNGPCARGPSTADQRGAERRALDVLVGKGGFGTYAVRRMPGGQWS